MEKLGRRSRSAPRKKQRHRRSSSPVDVLRARGPIRRNPTLTRPSPRRPRAVLFDRDGTLVVDVPDNGDPAAVRLMPGAAEAVALVHAAGLPTAVVSNQAGIARGVLDRRRVDAVNARVEALVGQMAGWFVCPHGRDDACACRKPRPGLVLQAASALGVDPADVVVIGDIGADMGAARAAGARGILVPTPVTLPAEIADADDVAGTLVDAVVLALAAARPVAEAIR